jgi:TetR/AcrR family transcriptional repressor of mexJK operon
MLGERFLSLVLSAEGLAWCRMSVAEGAKFPELRAALNRTGPGHVHDRLAAYLAMQARAGRLQVDNPFRAALHFFALIKSEDHFAALCGETIARSPEEISTQVRAAVRVFLGGYAA